MYCGVFFFKQKTAYEMRISDWSSDVCSSDLLLANHLIPSLFRLAMGDGSVEFDDTAEGLLSLVEHLEPDERTALGPVLHGITPKSEGSARLLLAAYDLVGKVDHVNGALRIAEAIAFDLEDDVAAKAGSEEHPSEIQSLMRISHAVFCLKKQ